MSLVPKIFSDRWGRASVQDAREILDSCFIGADEVCPYYGVDGVDVKIPYCVHTLKSIAAINQGSEKRYWLVYRTGLSAFDIRSKFLERFVSWSVWNREQLPDFLTMQLNPAYRLIDTHLELRGFTYDQGLKYLDEVKTVTPARLPTIVEMLVTLAGLRHYRFLMDGYHYTERGVEETPYVGNSWEGIQIYTLPAGAIERCGLDNVGVLMCRKPEFRERTPKA